MIQASTSREIAANAFKDATSLRRLDLNNNRIYRLQESAFTNIQRSVDRFDVSGENVLDNCFSSSFTSLSSRQPSQL